MIKHILLISSYLGHLPVVGLNLAKYQDLITPLGPLVAWLIFCSFPYPPAPVIRMGRSKHYISPAKKMRNTRRLVAYLKYKLSTLSISSSEPELSIPQLDGATLDMSTTILAQHDAFLQLHPQPGPNQPPKADSSTLCGNCHKVFETGEELVQHDESHQFGCEDCHLCFTTQFLADLHELANHPGTVYAVNYIPHSTKVYFVNNCK